jgi:hypothetical protein
LVLLPLQELSLMLGVLPCSEEILELLQVRLSAVLLEVRYRVFRVIYCQVYGEAEWMVQCSAC